MKVHRIHTDYSPDYKLIAIAAHQNDYRLSWAINTQLQFHFVRCDDLEIKTKEDILQCFTMYHYVDENTLLNYHLISNRSEYGLLFKEHINIDFFLKIFGDSNTNELQNLLQSIKSVDLVLTAVIIDPSSLKNPEKLLF